MTKYNNVFIMSFIITT